MHGRHATATTPPGLSVPKERNNVGTPTEHAVALLSMPLDNSYTGARMTVADALAWGASHAAQARDEAAAARAAAESAVAQLAGLQAAVGHLADVVGAAHGVDPEALTQSVRAAVFEAVASSVSVTGSLSVVAQPAPTDSAGSAGPTDSADSAAPAPPPAPAPDPPAPTEGGSL
jgi:hypothetical protein